MCVVSNSPLQTDSKRGLTHTQSNCKRNGVIWVGISRKGERKTPVGKIKEFFCLIISPLDDLRGSVGRRSACFSVRRKQTGEFDRKCWWVLRFRFVDLLQSKEEERDVVVVLHHPSARRCGKIETLTSDSVCCYLILLCFLLPFSCSLFIRLFLLCRFYLSSAVSFFLSVSASVIFFPQPASFVFRSLLVLSRGGLHQLLPSLSPFLIYFCFEHQQSEISSIFPRPLYPGGSGVHFIPRALRLAGARRLIVCEGSFHVLIVFWSLGFHGDGEMENQRWELAQILNECLSPVRHFGPVRRRRGQTWTHPSRVVNFSTCH